MEMEKQTIHCNILVHIQLNQKKKKEDLHYKETKLVTYETEAVYQAKNSPSELLKYQPQHALYRIEYHQATVHISHLVRQSHPSFFYLSWEVESNQLLPISHQEQLQPVVWNSSSAGQKVESKDGICISRIALRLSDQTEA